MTAKQRILIVDDETKIAFCLQESLESLNRNFAAPAMAPRGLEPTPDRAHNRGIRKRTSP